MEGIACAASSSVVEPRGDEAVRQRGLIDDADRPAVGSTQMVRVDLPLTFMGYIAFSSNAKRIRGFVPQ